MSTFITEVFHFVSQCEIYNYYSLFASMHTHKILATNHATKNLRPYDIIMCIYYHYDSLERCTYACIWNKTNRFIKCNLSLLLNFSIVNTTKRTSGI